MTSLGSWWQRALALSRRDCVMLSVLIVTVALYLTALHTHGWIPHDEGLLAQSAERVLQGQWPHRDFDDPYTGGLSLLHAAAMHVFGTDLLAMRRVLLLASLCFSAVLYRIARRVANPPLAVFVTWCAIAWGMPGYFAGLPSWYNLMAAAAALLCLLRAAEHGRAVDRLLAGVFGGVSLLIKIVGVFHIAAGLLALAFADSLLHHLDDAAASTLLRRLKSRVAPDGRLHVLDLVLPSEWSTAQVLARLDRGRHPRSLAAWQALFDQAYEERVFEPMASV